MKYQKWGTYLIKKFVDPSLHDEVLGDLLQEYHELEKETNPAYASRQFFLSSLGYFRYRHLLKRSTKTQNNANMDIWKNYFITSLRNLKRNKRYTFISLIGLIVGFISSLAIYQYVAYESSYDTFYPNEHIYRLTHKFTNNDGVRDNAQTFLAVKDAIKEAVPEIKHAGHFTNSPGRLKIGENVFQNDHMIAADEGFLEVLGLSLNSGHSSSLKKPDQIFLSNAMALKYFGRSDVIDEVIELQGLFGQNWKAQVAGVFEDFPDNSHLDVEVIYPMTKVWSIFREGNLFGNISMEDIPWRLLGYSTYVTLKSHTDIEPAQNKINEIIAIKREPFNHSLDQKHEIWLQPIDKIHITPNIGNELKATNDARTIWLFGTISFIILVIAWINYINLSTARAVTRGKEVGIRKVIGSSKAQLRQQFLVEVFLLNTMALGVALLALIPIAPQLEQIVGVPFHTNFIYDAVWWGILLGMLFIGTLFSGLYPAFLLSNYQCLDVLKGKLKYSWKGIVLRRVLVVTQFVCSLFLISALFIVQSQMNFMINHNLGVNIEQTYLLDAAADAVAEPGYKSKMETFRNQINQLPGIEGSATSSLIPGIQNNWRASAEQRTGEGAGLFIHRSMVDDGFLDLFELKLIAGRHLNKDFANEGNSLIVNETTRKGLGYQSPEEILNERLYFAGQEYKVVGVVDDFYQRGPHFAYEPISFSLDTGLVGNFIAVKINSNDIVDTIEDIESAYASTFPGSPVNGRFLDDVFQQQYTAQYRFRDLFTIFSLIALAIGCLGLIGLSAYMINQKMKEVSIRKVLGASGSSLFLLLNKEYIYVCLFAFMLAGPAIYFSNSFWLESFENRIAVHAGYYILPLMAILLIVLITTASFTLRAVKVNPADTLKDE